MYTAVLQVIIYQLAKYEKDQIKIAEKSQKAYSVKETKEKNNKEKTIQQEKGLPTLSADLNYDGNGRL